MISFALWLALLACAEAGEQPEADWGAGETQHFVVHRQAFGSSPGDDTLIETLYQSLHREVWSLVPWLDQDKVALYLYKDRPSYLRGRFHPPAWSGGLLSLEGEKALALPEPLDAAVAAHELTHLYLHSYFAGAAGRLPAWLDEGLATMLQDEALRPPDPRDRGPVLKVALPLERFMSARPADDSPQGWVALWYSQAHSVVRFLKRGHIEASFADFCGELRAGAGAEAALKKVYGYPDLTAFEAAWLRWRPKKALGLPVGLEDQ